MSLLSDALKRQREDAARKGAAARPDADEAGADGEADEPVVVAVPAQPAPTPEPDPAPEAEPADQESATPGHRREWVAVGVVLIGVLVLFLLFGGMYIIYTRYMQPEPPALVTPEPVAPEVATPAPVEEAEPLEAPPTRRPIAAQVVGVVQDREARVAEMESTLDDLSGPAAEQRQPLERETAPAGTAERTEPEPEPEPDPVGASAVVQAWPGRSDADPETREPSTVVWPDIRIQGAMRGEGGGSVVIDGQIIPVGQRHGDVLVRAIDARGVHIEYQGETRIFRVRR